MERYPVQTNANAFPDAITHHVGVVNETTGEALGGLDIGVAMPDDALSATSTRESIIAAVRGSHPEATAVHVDGGLVAAYNEEARSYILGGPKDGEPLSEDESAVFAAYEAAELDGIGLTPQMFEDGEPDEDELNLSLFGELDEPAEAAEADDTLAEVSSAILGNFVAVELLQEALPNVQATTTSPDVVEGVLRTIEDGTRPPDVPAAPESYFTPVSNGFSPILGREVLLDTGSVYSPDSLDTAGEPLTVESMLLAEMSEAAIRATVEDMDANGDTLRPELSQNQILVSVGNA